MKFASTIIDVDSANRAFPVSKPLRLALLSDYREEDWPSMDLCAGQLLAHLPAAAAGLQVQPVCPPFRRRVSRLPWLGGRGLARDADRLLNRFWDYPRSLRRQVDNYDLFHLCDHSYSQLVHVLPPRRTGVFCHDLDTFRCLLQPAQEPRPRWFRTMARRVLTGMQKAAVVFYTTSAVHQDMIRHGLIDAQRLVRAPLGAAPEFTPDPVVSATADALLAPLAGAPFLLHVGSGVPRKRIDILLRVFAAVRAHIPQLRLLQVGGSWAPQQQRLIDELGIAATLVQVRGLERHTLAALYQRAALVLVPSEAEGFGLPVIEALACGQVVLASDLEVFHEVGGDALVYCPVADVPAWTDMVCRLLTQPAAAPPLAMRLARARRFSWAAHAAIIAAAYGRLAGGSA